MSAQNATLKGKVYNQQNNEPLPFVNVVVSCAQIGAVTDIEGKFVIEGIDLISLKTIGIILEF